MNIIEIKTKTRSEAVDITSQVQQEISRAGFAHGAVLVCSAHTTAGITVNENADPDVMEDVLHVLSQLVPQRGPYAHTVEGNADAHIKASLVGLSACLPIENGRLVLGYWQGIFLCEFDGPRQRKVFVQLLATEDY